MSAWAETTLKKVAEKISYGYTASATEQNTGVKFLRITDIASGPIDWDTVPYCEISETDIEKCGLSEGEIVIARTGATVGYAKQIRRNPPHSVFASYLVRVRLKDNVCKRFVGILTESDNYKYYINTIAGGSAQPNANAQDLCSYPFYLPPIHVQQKLVAILSAYDELIENNQRRIALLEKMGEEIYREWFVRLRFLGHEKVKKVKGVPDGWRDQKFGQFCQLQRGFDLTDADVESGPYPVIASTSIKTYHSQYKVEPPVITTGRSGSLGEVLFVNTRAWPHNTALYVKKFFGNSAFLVYYTLKNMRLENFNAGAGVPTLNRNHLNGIPIIVPSKEIQDQFDGVVSILHAQAELLRNANQKLTMTRDSLLPRLISGKLSVENLDIQFPPNMEEPVHET